MSNFWKKEIETIIKNDSIFEKLKTYVMLILEYNKKFNLTGFDEEIIWKDGIYQSIKLLDYEIKNNKNFKLLDIGAGAGFPSVPFLIFKNNSFDLTIIEANKKRAEFLEIVKEKLKLTNLFILNTRAEEVKLELIEKFDYLTARAVAPLNILIEISHQYGKIGSKFFFLKSANIDQEINDAKKIINVLNINYEIDILDINDDRKHFIFTYLKQFSTPKGYPRKWNIINKD